MEVPAEVCRAHLLTRGRQKPEARLLAPLHSPVGVTDNSRRAQSIDRFDAIARTTPTAAAQRIIEGIEKNAPRILIGNDARFMDLLQRFRPGTYWAVLAKRIEKMTANVAK